MKKEIQHINVVDLRNLILALPQTFENSEEDYEKLIEILESESMRYLEYQFDQRNKHNLYQICYSWMEVIVQMDLETQNDWRKSGIKFPQKFAEEAIEFASQLSPEELLFALHISAFYKYLPGCEPEIVHFHR